MHEESNDVEAAEQPAAELPGIDEMTPEQAAEIAGIRQINIPMQTIDLAGGNLQIVRDEDGSRALVVGPIAFQFVLGLPAETARSVARELAGGVEIAAAFPNVPGGSGLASAVKKAMSR